MTPDQVVTPDRVATPDPEIEPIGTIKIRGTNKYEWPGTLYKPTTQELNSASSYTVDFGPAPSENEKGGRFWHGADRFNGWLDGGRYTFQYLSGFGK